MTCGCGEPECDWDERAALAGAGVTPEPLIQPEGYIKTHTWANVDTASLRMSGFDLASARVNGSVQYTLGADPPGLPPFMSTDSTVRKMMPVASGCLAYFPDALLLVSWVSRVGNDKHNPGQPLHWDKSKSQDEPDAEVRHMLDSMRGVPADPGLEPLGELGHKASKAWRALADLQRACDAERAKYEEQSK